jgi:hypothetical protein
LSSTAIHVSGPVYLGEALNEEEFMDSGNKFMVLASVVIVALILQIVLIFADQRESPAQTAIAFSKAYFKLDKDMRDFLCSEIRTGQGDGVVDDYIHRMAEQARDQGFEPSWMKMALSHIEAETRMIDEKTASVHLTGTRRRAANPLYGVVAKVFSLGETYAVEETLTVVKEADGWKVCGAPYALIES